MNPQAIEDFARLIRARRVELGLSQEAVAAAFGNPDRKTYLSALENRRKPRITVDTALKLAAALDLPVADLPAALRPPGPQGAQAARIEERLDDLERAATLPPSPQTHAADIARLFNDQLRETLSRPVMDLYRDRLAHGLASLDRWTGRPFGAQSLAVSFALSFVYVSLLGLAGYGAGAARVGSVTPFALPDWAAGLPPGLLALACAVILLACSAGCFVIASPAATRPGSLPSVALRFALAALVCGVGVALARTLGAEPFAVALVVAAAAFGALSAWPPPVAATAGVLGAFVSGISDGLMDARGLFIGLLNVAVVGGSIGATAGYLASLVARRVAARNPDEAAGAAAGPPRLAGAGAGLAVGVLASALVLGLASGLADVEPRVVGLMALMWVALPFANALTDFVSLGVSHSLGRMALRAGTGWRDNWLAVALDLVAALALMVLTLLAIRWGLTLGGNVFGIAFGAGDFLRAALADPWGQGLWLSLMVLTTLGWTWLHFALIVAPLAAARIVAGTLERPLLRRVARQTGAGRIDTTAGAVSALRLPLAFGLWALFAVAPLVMGRSVFGAVAALLP